VPRIRPQPREVLFDGQRDIDSFGRLRAPLALQCHAFGQFWRQKVEIELQEIA
jgi:hypothetical protein